MKSIYSYCGGCLGLLTAFLLAGARQTNADDRMWVITGTNSFFRPAGGMAFYVSVLELPSLEWSFSQAVENVPYIWSRSDKDTILIASQASKPGANNDSGLHGCVITEVEPSSGTVIDTYRHPRMLDGTNPNSAPLMGVRSLQMTADGTVWLQTIDGSSPKDSWVSVEALDWKTKAVKVSHLISPIAGATPKMFAIDGGVFVVANEPLPVAKIDVASHSADVQKLFFIENTGKVVESKLEKAMHLGGPIYSGATHGNILWSMYHGDAITRVTYDKSRAKIEVKSVNVQMPEGETVLCRNLEYDEGSGLLIGYFANGNGPMAIRLLHPDSGKVVKEFYLPKPANVAVYRKGKIYAVLENEGVVTTFNETMEIEKKSRPIFPVVSAGVLPDKGSR